MREPMLPELRELRALLRDHADKLPPELSAYLNGLIYWAGWKITGPSTLNQAQYQRYRLMREGHDLAVRKGLKTGLWKDARAYAMKMAAGSYAECGDEMMRKSYEDMRDATYE
jgi:hypothetical protein